MKHSCIFSRIDFTVFSLKTFWVQPPYVRAIFDFAISEQQGLLGDGPSTEAEDVKLV